MQKAKTPPEPEAPRALVLPTPFSPFSSPCLVVLQLGLWQWRPRTWQDALSEVISLHSGKRK